MLLLAYGRPDVYEVETAGVENYQTGKGRCIAGRSGNGQIHCLSVPGLRFFCRSERSRWSDLSCSLLGSPKDPFTPYLACDQCQRLLRSTRSILLLDERSCFPTNCQALPDRLTSE